MIKTLRSEPAAFWVTLAGTVSALIVALGHLSADQAAILAGLVTAFGSALTAFQTRPWNIPVIAGAAGVVVQSLVIVGLHPSSDLVAAVVQAVALILGLVSVRPNVTPVVTLKGERQVQARRDALKTAP